MQDTVKDKLINLAEQKQQLMKNFLKLTEEQAEAISQDNYEYLLNIIAQKQNIIEQVNLVDLDIPDNIPDYDNLLQTINAQTREIISQAVVLDNKNINLLKNNQDKIFKKLLNIHKNKKTHALYRGKNIKIEGILLDEKK